VRLGAILKTKKETEVLKAAIFRTFNELQEDPEQPYSLIEWAKANPKEFYTGLLPRLLPKPVELSAAEGTNFMLVYQVGDKQVCLDQNDQPAKDVIEGELIDDRLSGVYSQGRGLLEFKFT
jgi:hypothetical protein